MISSSNVFVAMMYFKINVAVLSMYPAEYVRGYKIVVCKPTNEKDLEDVNCNATISNENSTGLDTHQCPYTSMSCEDVMWYYFTAILIMVVVLTLLFAIRKYVRHLIVPPKSGNLIISVDEITPGYFDE